jgi:hypothetical protein
VALTEAWQAEIRSLVMGAGSDYPFVSPVDGLFAVPLRTDDLPAFDRTNPATDWTAARILSWRTGVDGTDPDDASDLAQALAAAWRRATSSEVTLDLWIPGTDWQRRFYGRPRLPAGAANLEHLRTGWVEVDVEFHCLDPFGYGAVVSDTANTGTFSILAADLGDVGADTDRATIIITGNGGTPKLTNNTTGGVIEFASTLANAAEANIDLRTGAVTVAGSPAPQAIDAASTWMRLAGGVTNSLTLTGATSVDIGYRPAYW